MRALVADDDRATVTIVTTLLKQLGLDVTAAYDGSTAWELLKKPPAPALAILDWMMPGVDGLELCRRIKCEPTLTAAHVILLTARNNHEDVVAALDAGIDDYVVKPFKFDELRTRVHAGIRVASLQERVVRNVSALQSSQRGQDESNMIAQARRGWLKLARDGVTRSRRYPRALGHLVQAAVDPEKPEPDSD